MGGAVMSYRRITAMDFLQELKREEVLINTDLIRAIEGQINQKQILDGEQCFIIRQALEEMNRREIGVYTAACITVAAINSFR